MSELIVYKFYEGDVVGINMEVVEKSALDQANQKIEKLEESIESMRGTPGEHAETVMQLKSAQSKISELEEANRNCISLSLHESRMAAAHAEIERLNTLAKERSLVIIEQAKNNDRLAKQNDIYRTALSDWLTWEQDQIRKDGPYVGKRINELIQQGLIVLKAGESK